MERTSELSKKARFFAHIRSKLQARPARIQVLKFIAMKFSMQFSLCGLASAAPSVHAACESFVSREFKESVFPVTSAWTGRAGGKGQ